MSKIIALARTCKSAARRPHWGSVAVGVGLLVGLFALTSPRWAMTPGTRTTLLAHKQADPALIYRIVKTIIDHGTEFGELHPGGREFTVEKTRSFAERNLVPIAFHPGAERYWWEKGVLK